MSEIDTAFEEWWSKYDQPYEAAVIAKGGEPWTTCKDERPALWHRRYQRPKAPEL